MPKKGRTRGRSCFMSGCDHPECREAHRVYCAEYWQVRKQYTNTVKNIDPSRARAHLAKLRESGMGVDTIAQAMGIRKNTLWEIIREQRPEGIKPDTERRILAVQPRPAWVDSTGSVRRLRALAALGHTFDKAAAELGLHHRTVSKIACGHVPTLHRETADRITLLFERWSMIEGPSARIKSGARNKGWAPPLAWDDDIDDPEATPMGVRTGARQTLDLDEWWMLVQAGEDPERAADRFGVTLSAVERASWRADRNDIAAVAASARKRWSAA